MGKTAIIYGSTTGTTEDIAGRIASKLNIAQGDIYEISKVTADTVAGYDTLLLGSSTWGSGDLQDDWYDGIETLKGADLAGKKIALFGCGDSSSYSDTFCSALGTIYNDLKAEREGFEPSIRENRIPDFESGAFDHSAISPQRASGGF